MQHAGTSYRLHAHIHHLSANSIEYSKITNYSDKAQRDGLGPRAVRLTHHERGNRAVI